MLESTFTSLTDVVRGYGVPDWLIIKRFDTRAVLDGYRGPVLILHGAHDVNIPVSSCACAEGRRAECRIAPHACGHNDCPPQWELVLSFLAANGVCRKPDQETTHEKVDIC